MDVVRVYSCLEKGVGHVQFTPDFPFRTVREYVIYAWEWVGVKNRVGIQDSVVIYPTW